jgi:hypothetical protein
MESPCGVQVSAMGKSSSKIKIEANSEGWKNCGRLAALMELDDEFEALGFALNLALECAKRYVKGNTEVLCVKPEFASLYENNKEFFNALCEEGVVEWLTLLVLTKSVNSRLNHHEE